MTARSVLKNHKKIGGFILEVRASKSVGVGTADGIYPGSTCSGRAAFERKQRRFPRSNLSHHTISLLIPFVTTINTNKSCWHRSLISLH